MMISPGAMLRDNVPDSDLPDEILDALASAALAKSNCRCCNELDLQLATILYLIHSGQLVRSVATKCI